MPSEPESPSSGPDDGPPPPTQASSVVGRRLHVGALAAYKYLPLRLKRFVAGWLTPSFQVAAGSIVQRDDGAVLMVRHSYRKGWGIPGGFLKRGEHPAEAATREAYEELGIRIQVRGQPVVIIVPHDRRILVAFRATVGAGGLDGEDAVEAHPRSPEISAVEWFPIEELPRLQDDVSRAMRDLGLRRP